MKIVYGVPIKIRKAVVKLLSKLIGATYIENGIITDKNCDFMKEPDFIKAYKAELEHESKKWCR